MPSEKPRLIKAFNLRESMTAQLLSALQKGDRIVSLSMIDTRPTSVDPLNFVNTATRLANEHKATSLQFFQLDHNTEGGDVWHIAVLTLPQADPVTA
jgi:hypothetical protein